MLMFRLQRNPTRCGLASNGFHRAMLRASPRRVLDCALQLKRTSQLSVRGDIAEPVLGVASSLLGE
jgi:hypothetical protein